MCEIFYSLTRLGRAAFLQPQKNIQKQMTQAQELLTKYYAGTTEQDGIATTALNNDENLSMAQVFGVLNLVERTNPDQPLHSVEYNSIEKLNVQQKWVWSPTHTTFYASIPYTSDMIVGIEILPPAADVPVRVTRSGKVGAYDLYVSVYQRKVSQGEVEIQEIYQTDYTCNTGTNMWIPIPHPISLLDREEHFETIIEVRVPKERFEAWRNDTRVKLKRVIYSENSRRYAQFCSEQTPFF